MDDLRGICILVAEDDPMVSEMVQGMLTDLDHKVVGNALDGVQAVKMAQSLHPDVILMDLEMPNMNGIKAAEYIIENLYIPVVMLTAHETPELVAQAANAGVGAYLVKPPDIYDIERAIAVAMARFKDMQELHRLNVQLQIRNEELQAALEKIKRLSGLLPICASCKKIRNDEGYWEQVEIYVSQHSDVNFSHSTCSDCIKLLYSDIYNKIEMCEKPVLNALFGAGWMSLDDVSKATGLAQTNVHIYLKLMVQKGQLRYLTVDSEDFFSLL